MREIRKMYFIYDLLLESEEIAKERSEGKEYLVREVYVGCEAKDLKSNELDIDEYRGYIFSDPEKLMGELSYE